MSKQTITDVQMKEFLKDYTEYSETTILEEGKERDDILEIASAKGIELKDSRDLAGFKTVYTFADKANNNRARLPKEKLLKALPGMIGKPVNIDHNRRYVVGHYIDYKYRQKDDMVIAYGVFYKSNFESEWEEAKQRFADGTLSTSYEIWCPKSKRIPLPDGTVELTEQEIAGGALLYKKRPAFRDSKVLELAMEKMDKMEEQMVFASDKKYSDDDLLFIASENVVAEPAKAEVNPKVKCQGCGAELDYLSIPEKGMGYIECPTCHKNIDQKGQVCGSKTKCANCKHEFDNTNVTGQVKCSECFAILDKTGTMLFPPQIIDFEVACSNCRSRNWLLQSKKDTSARIKCQSCAKEYEVTYESIKALSDDILKLNFLFISSTSCPQCHATVEFSGIHKTTKYDLKCKKCGLSFAHDVTHENVKKITKIEEIKVEQPVSASAVKSAEQEGEPKMVLIKTKYHRYFEGESFDDFTKTLSDDYSDGDVVIAAKLSPEQRMGLKDSDFAVVIRAKNKKTGKTEKIRKYPIQDEAHVRNAMARLGQEPSKKELEALGVSVESVKAKVLARAKMLGMKSMVEEPVPAQASVEPTPVPVTTVETKVEPVVAEQKPVEPVKPVVEPVKPEQAAQVEPEPVVEVKPKETPVVAQKQETPKVEDKPVETPKVSEKPVNAARCKIAKKVKLLRKAAKESKKILEKASEDAEKKIEFYKTNALKIKTRRDELLEFASDMSDEDIVIDDKYSDAKVKKENAKLEQSSEKVGTKPQDEGYYKSTREEIDRKAFGHLHPEQKK